MIYFVLGYLFFAVVAASIALGNFLASHWRMPDYAGKIILVLFAFFAGTAICAIFAPQEKTIWVALGGSAPVNRGSFVKRRLWG